jgi:hypothetical protein
MTTDHPHHENPQRDCITLDRTPWLTELLQTLANHVPLTVPLDGAAQLPSIRAFVSDSTEGPDERSVF